jgi:biotin operon repressor
VTSSRGTQCTRILDLLIAARGEWVPLPTIANQAKQYNARIHSLRGQGYRIANRTKLVDGAKHSWYRLEPPSASWPSSEARKAAQPPLNTFPEFGSLARESYGVD